MSTAPSRRTGSCPRRERCRPVRDDHHRRALLLELDDAFGKRLVAFGVEIRARLVEHDQVGLAEDGPRQGDPLPVAAGKRRAAFADLGLVSSGNRRIMSWTPAMLRRLDDLGIGPGSEAADVGGDRIGEELDILRQIAEITAERLARPGRNVGAIEPHRARGRPQHADDMRASVDFPAPDGPMMPSASPGSMPKRDIAQDRLVELPGVNVVERFRPTGGPSASAASALLRRRAGKQQVADAVEGAARRDKAAPLPDDLFDRLQRPPEQDACREHRADCRHAARSRDRRRAQDERLHRHAQELDHALHGGGAVACR